MIDIDDLSHEEKTQYYQDLYDKIDPKTGGEALQKAYLSAVLKFHKAKAPELDRND